MNVDLLQQNNTWGALGLTFLPAIVGTTNVSSQGATTNCVPNYLLAYLPSISNAPAINLSGTVLTPSQIFANALQVANSSYVQAAVSGAFLNAGNEGITFTVNQNCPTRLTASTFLANTEYVQCVYQRPFRYAR